MKQRHLLLLVLAGLGQFACGDLGDETQIQTCPPDSECSAPADVEAPAVSSGPKSPDEYRRERKWGLDRFR